MCSDGHCIKQTAIESFCFLVAFLVRFMLEKHCAHICRPHRRQISDGTSNAAQFHIKHERNTITAQSHQSNSCKEERFPLLIVSHRFPGGRLGWTGVAKQLAVAAVAVGDNGVRPLL